MHITQYSTGATVTRAGGLGVAEGIDAIIVALVLLVVGANTSIKVGIAALDSGKCPR